MADWATSYSFGGPNWAGTPPIVTLAQFNSSIGYTSTVSNALSTTTGTVSNILQGEINSIVAGGTTSLWANYPAIQNVDMAGYSLNNARFVSTLDLQVSSINGTDIGIKNSTITIQGVTVTNNTVTASNIKSSNASTSNSALDTFVGGVNAVASAVTNVNQAVGGFLSNNFGVLQQAYWGVALAGQVVDLANGTVQLATGIQGMVDARQVQTLSGDTNINAVFETINHTAQLQFSTLNSTTMTYYRTTDQANPNASFGREIIISSYISAGTKCLRSIGDPLNVPIASTVLLSTTNFVQAFGQWVPILATDNNLNANSASISTLTVSSIYGNWFSTGVAFISSINNQPISAFINTGDVAFTSVSTNSISSGTAGISSIYANYISSGNAYVSSVRANSFSTAVASISSLNTNAISTGTITISNLQAQTAYISSLYASTVTVCNLIENYASTTTGYFDIVNASTVSIFGNLVFSTMARGYDISKVYISTTTTYDKVSSLTQDILGYQMNLTTTNEPESFDMGSWIDITAANSTLWSKKQLDYSGTFVPGQAPTINIVPGSFTTGDYFDVKNLATNGQILNVWNPYVSGGLLLQMTPGTYYRFTYSGSSWTYAANPTTVGASYFNTFAISQGWDQTTISTGNVLNLIAGEVSMPGFTSMDKTNINYLTAGGATFSTIVTPYISTSAAWLSSINNTNITTVLNPTTLPFLSTTSISTAQLKTSSITANTLTFTSPLANPNGSYDISRQFASTITVGSYDNVSSITANILNYNLSATIPNEATFVFGSVFTAQYNDAQWANQFLVANLYSGGTIILLHASATNYFDCQNQGTGAELLVVNYLSGNPVTLFTVQAGNLTIYRVTATVVAGVTTWSYAVSPGIYNPTTVTNNLIVSADLQNTYISSINRVQFNTGEVYFNAPIYAPNAYIDNFVLNNVNASTITSKIASISSASISTLTAGIGSISTANISTLAATSINTSSLNTTSVISKSGTISSLVVSTMTIGNESIGTVYATTQITTSQTFANSGDTTTYPFYSIVNWTTPQNYLSNISSATLFASQFNYKINQGYVNLNLGLISNIAIDSNLNVVATNKDGGTTSFSGISSCIGCTFYPPAGAGGMFITMQTPTAALLASGYTFYISNTAASGGVDRCYNTGFYYTYNGFYTVQSYADFKLGHVFSGAGSGQAAFEVMPLSPFPFTPYSPAINDAVALTHRAGNATSLNSTSNVNFNTCNANFNSYSVTACNVQGASWFANLGGGYISWGNSTATGSGILSYKGTTFPVSQYNCTIALLGTHVSCNAYGTAQTSLSAYNSGGVWAWNAYFQIQGNVHTFDPNLNVSWDGSIQMTPKPFVSLTPDALYDISGNPWFLGSTLSTLTTIPFLQEAFVSSMTASTLTIKAVENIAILADLSPPTFLGIGTVAINANSNIDLMANYDINIDAGHSMTLTANSTISIQGIPFDNYQGSVITSTPTFTVSNSNITNTSLVFLTPASAIDKPYWVTYNPFSSFCINVSSLASPTVMNYWVASYSGYGQQLSTSIDATGGTITTVSGRKFHTFTSSGTFVVNSNPIGTTIEIMIIGGGGGGGAQSGGGGGAGNMLIVTSALTPSSYSISIGPGGVGAVIGTSASSNGGDTTFGTFMTAPGGGGGGTYSISDGLNGGCGGGGAEYTQLAAGLGTAGTVTSGTTISNLYNDGGAGYYSGSMGGAGGGGTSTAGGTQTGLNSIGAPGGDGTSYYGTTYGGGGGGQGGGTYNPPYSDIGGDGGSGGGGKGGRSTGNGISGTGYGSGGGGGNTGGSGSSGICIVSYIFP